MRTTKLTRKQKLLLAEKGLKPENWQLEKETPELLYIVNKNGNRRLIKKEM